MFTTRARVSDILLKRQAHKNAQIIENCKDIKNRNPRNLERLRIARRPAGYFLEKPGFMYWHKLVVTPQKRYVSAEIHHFENGPVITASSNEWALKQQLYRLDDISAYRNVGCVLAQRCLESGIIEIYFDKSSIRGEKIKILTEELQKFGIALQEPTRYKHPSPWTIDRPEKPWEIHE